MKPLFTAIFLLTISFIPDAGLCETHRIVTPHFVVRYEDIGDKYAELVSQSAEYSFGIISDTLGHTPVNTITIILTSTDEEFRKLTQGTLPDWSAAVAIPGNRIIISPLPGLKMNIERILAHEIVHCIIHDASGCRGERPFAPTFVPRWFHEGCAETFSGQWGIRGRLYMVWKVLHGDLLSFEEIELVFSARGADVTLAYDQSMLAVKRLTSVYGSSVLPEILDGLQRGNDFGRTFADATGLTPDEFERDYLKAVGKAYGKRMLFTFIPGIWTIILILAVIVYAIKRYRTKRLMSQWEVVEAAENIIRFRPYPPDE